MTNQTITPTLLLMLSKRKEFDLGSFHVISQEPTAVGRAQRIHAVTSYLPQFINLWRDIERVTGHAWKCTSYIRNSPSHRKAQAFDLAPDIAPEAEDKYAVTHMSDPVLYKREPMIRQLQSLRSNDYSGNGSNDIGIFIEPDHLHIQVLASAGDRYPTKTVKWKQPKPIYSDTNQRMLLPMTSTGY